MKSKYIMIFIALLVSAICIAGCINNTPTPTVVTVKEIGQPALLYSYPTTIPTVPTPAPIIKSVSGYSSRGTSEVIIPGSDKHLFYPNSWTVKTISGSQMKSATSDGSTSNLQLTDAIYIISPSKSTIVAGEGVDISTMIFGSSQFISILDKGYITDDELDENSLIDSYEKDGYTNVQFDPTYYKINGNPARSMSFDSSKDNTHVSAYIIVSDSKMGYVTMIIYNANSPSGEVSQGYQIIQSFV
ncbi:MAG: hypothetical protein WCX79_00795 [Candidatus Paceibacterota bacterium]|jgi:hypothetical protein